MKGPKDTAILATTHRKSNPLTTKKKAKTDKSKNSGAPKRPPTAFLIFMQEFRHENKENFPDLISATKECGVKWKSMSESEKAPYVAKAAKKKAEYDIAMKQYNDDLNATEIEKSASTSILLGDTKDDMEQEDSISKMALSMKMDDGTSYADCTRPYYTKP